jgi:beta-glucosidase
MTPIRSYGFNLPMLAMVTTATLILTTAALWLSFPDTTQAASLRSDRPPNIFIANNSTAPTTQTSGGYNSTSAHNSSTPSSQSTWNYTSPPFPYPLNTSSPSHSANPSAKWEEAHLKARQRLTNWTLEEKVQLTTGTGWEIGRCVGNIPAIPSQGFEGLCLEDSPLGVRFADFVSAFPAGINVAST